MTRSSPLVPEQLSQDSMEQRNLLDHKWLNPTHTCSPQPFSLMHCQVRVTSEKGLTSASATHRTVVTPVARPGLLPDASCEPLSGQPDSGAYRQVDQTTRCCHGSPANFLRSSTATHVVGRATPDASGSAPVGVIGQKVPGAEWPSSSSGCNVLCCETESTFR